MIVKLLPIALTTALATGALALYNIPRKAPSPPPQNKPHVQIPVTKLEEGPVEQPGVRIDPYWVHMTPTSATLAWRLPEKRSSSVRIGSDADPIQVLTTPVGYQHQAKLSELEPDKAYTYQVPGFPEQVFRTPSDQHEVRFAVLGHTHGSEHSSHYPDELLVARVADSAPSFVVHAGDCVFHADPAGWAHDFFRLFRSVLQRVPVYVSPGNHDSGWPFLRGYDLRPFRALFPLDYPEGVGQGPAHAFYRVRRGPLEFYFLSYVDDMSPESVQMQWLQQAVTASTAPFRLVVFGGMNRYYDEPATLQALAKLPLDAVINGDGAAPKDPWSVSEGLPRFRLGTGGAHPHPWLAGRATEEAVHLKLMYADGSSGVTYTLHRRHADPADRMLGAPERRDLSAKQTRFTFALPEPKFSSEAKRIQVEWEQPLGQSGVAYVYFRAKKNTGRGEMGIRSQYLSLSATDRMASFALPALEPQSQTPYEIIEVHLEMVGFVAERNRQTPKAWFVAR